MGSTRKAVGLLRQRGILFPRSPQHRHLFENRQKVDLWHRLEDIAARVYLYFPVSDGWRTQELAASVKYLSPVVHQSDWTDRAAADWQRMQPILAGAGQAASALGVVPGVGTVAAGAAPVLSAMSKLQVGAVPQASRDSTGTWKR